jgi:hypothetical protein
LNGIKYYEFSGGGQSSSPEIQLSHPGKRLEKRLDSLENLVWSCPSPRVLGIDSGLLPYVLQNYPSVGKYPGFIGAGLSLIANLMKEKYCMRIFCIFNQAHKDKMMKHLKEVTRHWKAVLAASLIACAVNASFADGIKPGAPAGWQLWGPQANKFEIGIDPAESTTGYPALIIASKPGLNSGDNDSLAITQDIDGSAWEDQVIELSMMVKAVGASKNKIWIRHMRNTNLLWIESKSIPGDKDWEKMTLKTYFPKNLPAEYRHFDIGITLASAGKIWVRDIQLDKKPVSEEVRKLELPSFRSGLPANETPRNLNFIE